MAHLNFTKATDFLSEQLKAGNNFRRVGVIVRTTFDNASDISKQLDELFHGAWDKLDAAVSRKLADHAPGNQRAALQLSYAGSLRTSVPEQLQMLRDGRDSEMVCTAAAQQKNIPTAVQAFLVNECSHHRNAMTALARNRTADLGGLEPLATHPNGDVRMALVAHLASKMRMVNESENGAKQAVYNALIKQFESEYSLFLVPTCRDELQLDNMYALTTKNAGLIRPFVENPFSSAQLLLDVSSSMTLRLTPGGSAVAAEAKQHLEKRLAVERDAAPQLD